MTPAQDSPDDARARLPEGEMRILHARADALARRGAVGTGARLDTAPGDPARTEPGRPDAGRERRGPVDHLGFTCAGGRYLIESRCVAEVLPVSQLPPLAPVPGRPAGVAGLCNVRGRVVPVFRFHDVPGVGSAFRAPSPGPGDAWLLILDDDEDGRVGLLVDAVVGIEPLLEARVRRVPPGLVPAEDGLAGARRAVTDDGTFVLSGTALLGGPALRASPLVPKEVAP